MNEAKLSTKVEHNETYLGAQAQDTFLDATGAARRHPM